MMADAKLGKPRKIVRHRHDIVAKHGVVNDSQIAVDFAHRRL